MDLHFLIGFGLGFAEAGVLVQRKELLGGSVLRGEAGRDLGFWGDFLWVVFIQGFPKPQGKAGVPREL